MAAGMTDDYGKTGLGSTPLSLVFSFFSSFLNARISLFRQEMTVTLSGLCTAQISERELPILSGGFRCLGTDQERGVWGSKFSQNGELSFKLRATLGGVKSLEFLPFYALGQS